MGPYSPHRRQAPGQETWPAEALPPDRPASLFACEGKAQRPSALEETTEYHTLRPGERSLPTGRGEIAGSSGGALHPLSGPTGLAGPAVVVTEVFLLYNKCSSLFWGVNTSHITTLYPSGCSP